MRVRQERQRRQVKWDAACMPLPWATGSQPHRIRGCKNSEAGNVFRDLYGKMLPTRAPVSWCAGAQTLVIWGTGRAPGNVSKLEGDHRVRWDVQVVCHPALSPESTHSPSPRLSTLKGPQVTSIHSSSSCFPWPPSLPGGYSASSNSVSEGQTLL